MPSFGVGEAAFDLDEGLYDALIQSIKPAIPDPNKPRDPRFDKPQLVITYLLTEVERDDGSEITRRQYVNEVAALTPKSTLYSLFSTFLHDGGPLDKARQYDTDELIDKRCQIFWGSYVGEKGDKKMKILSVSAPKRQKAGAGAVRRRSADEPIDPDEL